MSNFKQLTCQAASEAPLSRPQQPPAKDKTGTDVSERLTPEELARILHLRIPPNQNIRLVGGRVPLPKLPPNFEALWAAAFPGECP